MPLMALTPQARTIPPDLAAVLGDAPIHPALLRAPGRPASPTVATLTQAALSLANYAAQDAHAAQGVHTGVGGWLPVGVEGFIHTVGNGGVLHLESSSRPRAVSLAHGALEQRCTGRPRLRPGTVRLLPPGHSVTLADLEGNGALAVEVVF